MPWWIDTSSGLNWTDEEQRVRKRIALIAMVVIWPFFIPEMWLFNRIGIDQGVGALIDFATAGPIGFFLARKICEWRWPDTVKAADASAATRLARQNSN
jgi:hypothetical protein